MASPVISNTFRDVYRDDFRDSDNYYKILFNNGRALQQRELNQMQTIIGKNVQTVSDFLLKNGSRATGGEHRVNQDAEFVKLQAATTLPSDLTLLEQVILTETGTNIQIEIIKALDTDGADPPTIYVTYIDGDETGATSGTAPRKVSADGVLTGQYVDANGNTVAISYNIQEAAVSSTANPATGKGCVFTVETGRYYIDGNFVFTAAQSIVLSKYTPTADAVVGFRVSEQIITSNDDQQLFDNSGINLNLAAPGADRYKVSLSLIQETQADSDDYFIKLVEVNDGVVFKEQDISGRLGIVGEALEDYRYDESGNYLVNGGKFSIVFPEDSDAIFQVHLSPGLAYVGGRRIEWNTPMIGTAPKPRQTKLFRSKNTATSYGNYIQFSSMTGIPNIDTFQRCEIKNNTTWGSGTTIGYCRIRSIERVGTRYHAYIFEVTMVPGNNFGAARSIGVSAANNGVIQLAPTGKAEILGRENNNLLMDLPFERPSQLSDITLTVADRMSGTTNGSGVLTLSAGSGNSFDDTGSWIVANQSTGAIASPTITNSVSSATLSGLSNSTAYDVLVYKQRAGVQRSKTLSRAESTIATDSSGNVILPHTDIINLNFAVDASDSSDVSTSYELFNGQSDNFYTNGTLLLEGGETAPANVKVNYTYLAHGGSGDFFAKNSYDGQVAYEDIPSHVLRTGDRIELREVLDFRSTKGNADSDYDTGTIVKLPRNGDLINYDLQIFLPRKMRVLINSETRTIGIPYGKSSQNPKLPETGASSRENMEIAHIHLNAYMLDEDDMGVQFFNNQRYTMRDIGKIADRVSRVEEQVALTMLEMDSKIFEVLDSSGNNRLKAGISADPFDDQSQSDTRNPEYRASIDIVKGEVRPEFFARVTDLIYDSDRSFNTRLMGDTIYVNHSETPYISQTSVSREITINPHGSPRVVGTMVMSPVKDKWFEETRLPKKIIKGENTLDTSKTKLFGNWNFDWSGVEPETMKIGKSIASNQVNKGNKTVREGNFDVTYKQTKNQEYFISGAKTVFESLGDVVRNKITIESMRSLFISFKATGMRPNTRYFPFFGGKPVDDWVNDDVGFQRKAALPKTSVYRKVGDVYASSTSFPIGGKTTLVANGDGTVEGYFFVPSNDTINFDTGVNQFYLIDVSGPNSSEALLNSTSHAKMEFRAEGMLHEMQEEVLSTKVFEVESDEDIYSLETNRKKVPTYTPPYQPYNDGGDSRGPPGHEENSFEEGDSGDAGDGGGSGGGKVVCTAMLDMYGFGSFRNAVWMKHDRNGGNGKYNELGYHKIFGPLAEIMPNHPLLAKALGRWARVRTLAVRKKMQGKRVPLEYMLYAALIKPPTIATGWLIDKGILKPYKNKRK